MDTQKPQTTDPTVTDQAALVAFIDTLIKEKGSTLEGEELAKKRTQMLGEINDKINLNLVNVLPEEKQKDLEEMLQKEVTDTEIASFFSANIPDIQREITRTLLEYRTQYLEGTVS